MDRREFAKTFSAGLIGAGLVSSGIIKPLEDEPDNVVFWQGDRAFIRMRAQKDTHRADIVMAPESRQVIGVATESARAGQYMQVQVYGPSEARVAF